MNEEYYTLMKYINILADSAGTSLYQMMLGNESHPQRSQIDREEIRLFGFELALRRTKIRDFPSALIFRHNPSHSTMLIEDNESSRVKIMGARREKAIEDLVKLLRPYGFELREERHS